MSDHSSVSRRLALLAAASLSLAVSAATLPVALAAQPKAEPKHEHKHDHKGHDHDHGDAKDLNGVLAKAEQFSTLVGLLKQADLEEALEEGGPYTVFAPTNDAFNKLPEAALDELAKPENKARLKALLLAHVVKGKLTAADLHPGTELETLAGTKLKLTASPNPTSPLLVGGQEISKPDLLADNGVIHALDGVIQ